MNQTDWKYKEKDNAPGAPSALFIYAVIGKWSGNDTGSYRFWIPPVYQALCILVIHLDRQVSPLPILQMSSLRPREIKTLAPLRNNLQTWVSGLFDSKDRATFHCHPSPYPLHGRSGKADPADSGGTHGWIGLLRRGSKGRGRRPASGVSARLLEVMWG